MPLFASFLAGVLLFFLSGPFPFSSIFIFLSGSAFLCRTGRFLLILVVMLGFVYSLVRMPHADDIKPVWNRNIVVSGRLADKGALTGEKRGFVVESARDEETDEEIGDMEDRTIWLTADEELSPDETYDLLVRTGSDRSRLNPGSPAGQTLYARLIEVKDHSAESSEPAGLFRKARSGIAAYLQNRYPKDTAAFISSVTVGVYDLDDDLRNAFSTTGLAHILSISGAHFGIFTYMVFGISLFLLRRLPYSILQKMTLYVTPSQAAAASSLPLMIFYLGISGGSVPAVRSFIMIVLFLFGLLIGRKGFWLNSIFLAAFLLVIWDPGVVLDLSFQLSFIAVLFIGFSVEKGESPDRPEGMKAKVRNFVSASLRMTLAAALGTAPIVAYHFHYFSVISPVANLAAAPLIGFIVIPLALFSSISYLLTGVYLFGPLVGTGAELSLDLVKLMAKIPHADISMPAFPPGFLLLSYACFLPYLFLGRKRMLLVVPAVPLIVYFAATVLVPRPFSVTFLDVGQGDSAVAELPDGRTLVIDTGRTGREAAGFLKYLGKRDIDALVLTHSHPDHTGGAEALLERFRVKELWDNGSADYPDGFPAPAVHQKLQRGDLFEGKGCSISVLHPYPEFYTMEDDEYVGENNSSLVLKVTGNKSSVLMLGDVENEAGEDLQHLGKWIHADLIKVPHHGGRSSVHTGMFGNIGFTSAVIPVGRSNSFGHPSREMLELLANRNIYRTDRDGAVKAEETGRGLKVKTFRDMQFEKTRSIKGELRNLRLLFSSW